MTGTDRDQVESGDHPLRVCQVVGRLGSGGRESLLRDIVENSGPAVSHEVCAMDAADPVAADFERAGAPVFDVRADSHFDVGALVRVWRFLRHGGFDVVHAHGPTSQVPVRVLGRLAGTGGVVSTHHIVREEHGRWMDRLERLTRPLDAVTVAVSRSVRDSYAAEDWRVVTNGIDVDSFRADVDSFRADVDAATGTDRPDQLPDADPLFLNVGRYTPQKAQADLVAAMPAVLESLPDAHLCIVGGRGSLADDLRTSAYAEGVADRVTVTGRVPSVAPYYGYADAYVSSSLNEGLPIVVLEAMAAGLPVVATDVPGNRDAVIDGETGVLVPPQNPDQLAEAMVRVVTTGDDDRLGERGLERVRERYSIQRTVAEYCSLYREVAGRTSTPENRAHSPRGDRTERASGNAADSPAAGSGGGGERR